MTLDDHSDYDTTMSHIENPKKVVKFANYTLTVAQDDKLEIWSGSWRDGYRMVADGKMDKNKIIVEGKYPKEYHLPRAVIRNLERGFQS